jgi:hypothetical protein
MQMPGGFWISHLITLTETQQQKCHHTAANSVGWKGC